MCHIYLLTKTMGINMCRIYLLKNNGNKHVSYLPVKKTMGINMCHIYLLKNNGNKNVSCTPEDTVY